MKRSLILAGLCVVLCVPAVYSSDENTPCEITIIQQHDYSSQLIDKIRMQRETIYNALNLTPKQLKCNAEIEKKRYIELEPELKKLCIYSKELKDAKAKNDNAEICRLEKKLKDTRKEIQKISAKYDKEFMKILNSDQRAKYKMIRKMKRTDLKKQQRINQNGSKQSDVKPFGEKMTQAEYTEKKKQESCFWNKIKRNKNKN